MESLSPAQVDEICLKIIEKATEQNQLFSTHLLLMYLYGLRVGETLLSSGIYKDLENNLYIEMPKTGYTRKISSDPFINALDVDQLIRTNLLSYVNKRALERLIKNVCPYALLRVGNKGINTHIFRHNYAKKQYQFYQSVEAVNMLLQEKTLHICRNYITSQIYC